MKKRGKYERIPEPKVETSRYEKMKKRTLLQSYVISLISLCLCATMLMGTTMAWFTSEVTVQNNEIYTGILEADLKLKNGNEWKSLKGDGAPKVFGDEIKWEPDHVEVRTLTVENNGDLAMNYHLTLIADRENSIALDKTVLDDSEFAKLAQKFVVYAKSGAIADNEETTFAAISAKDSGWTLIGTLGNVFAEELVVFRGVSEEKDAEGKFKPATYSIAVYMHQDAESELMGQKLSFDVKLTAYQLGAPEPDGVTEPEEETPEENVTYIEITPENLSTITFTSDTQYKLKGDFEGKNVNLCLPVGVENVTFDGKDATNIGELIVTQNGELIDNYNTVGGERSGKVIIQNFTVQSQIDVYACKTEVEICKNTMESLMVYAGNVALNIHDNTIDANFKKHTNYRNAEDSWGNENEYAVTLMIFEYDLKFDDNTVTDAYSHAVGINGYQTTYADSKSTNKIQSFTGNNITVNTTEKDKRAALKIWDDKVYAPQDNQNAINAAAQGLIDTILDEPANNTFATQVEG